MKRNDRGLIDRALFAAALLAFWPGILLASNSDSLVVRVSDSGQVYWVEEVAAGLNFPSSIGCLPDGDMLVSERLGGLRLIRHGRLDPKPVSGTPETFRSLFHGLREVVVDADFRTNHALYLLVAEGTFEQNNAAVYRARLDAGALTDVARIFRSTAEATGSYVTLASRMTLLADGTLLFALAEDRSQPSAQQFDSQKGKVLRINRDGSIPSDNPFVNTPGALPEIWSYGHRVPLGLYQDPRTSLVWQVESGPLGGDELNLLKAGANYGWAKTSWGFAYSGGGLEAPLQSAPGIEDPILVWTPSATPSGITRYRGTTYPAWDGDYFVGHLTSRALVRMRIDGNRVVLQESMLVDLDERIRDVRVCSDNYLYMLTDHQNGRLLRIRAGRPLTQQLSRVAHRLEQVWLSDAALDFPNGGDEPIENISPEELTKGQQAFVERCAACHSVGTVVQGGRLGPDLSGVYGRMMGRQPGFDYSPSMSRGLIAWRYATLDRFLVSPGRLVPGTRMSAPPVSDGEVRRYIIGFLKQQSSSWQ